MIPAIKARTTKKKAKIYKILVKFFSLNLVYPTILFLRTKYTTPTIIMIQEKTMIAMLKPNNECLNDLESS